MEAPLESRALLRRELLPGLEVLLDPDLVLLWECLEPAVPLEQRRSLVRSELLESLPPGKQFGPLGVRQGFPTGTIARAVALWIGVRHVFLCQRPPGVPGGTGRRKRRRPGQEDNRNHQGWHGALHGSSSSAPTPSNFLIVSSESRTFISTRMSK